VEAGDTFQEEITIPREYNTNEKRLKAVKAAYETDQLKPVNILSYEVLTRKYYMLESDFIQHAKIEAEPVREQKETETQKQAETKEKEINLVKPSLKGRKRRKKRK
jgi:hypothetical protein